MLDESASALKSVPWELACASKIRQWGVPGEKYCRKAPVMETVIQKRKKITRNYLHAI